MWIPIAIELLKWLGPIFVKWFLAWLAKRMEEASERLPAPSSFGSDKERHLALLQEVYDSTSWLQLVKKLGVGRIIEKVEKHPDLASIPSEEMKEMSVGLAA